MNREQRPTVEAPPEIPAKRSGQSVAVEDRIAAAFISGFNAGEAELTDEDRLAAFISGYEQGKAERVEAAIEDEVLARLHAQALEALGMARQLARVKGMAWSRMLVGEPE